MTSRSICAALFLIAGCISTRATVAPNANLTQYRTFAFAPETNQAFARTPTGAVVRDALTRELAAKGIYPASPGTTPDFYVGYRLALRQELEAYGWGGYGGWGGWGWGGPAVYEYTEGTLVVDFVDPRTNQSFWRGTASTVVNTPDNPNPKRMAKGVAEMMDKYPANLTASGPAPTRM